MLVPRLRVWQRPAPLRRRLIAHSWAALIVGLAVWFLTRPAPPRVVRLTVTPSGATALGIGVDPDLAISPDGTRLAYVGAGGPADRRARLRSA